MSSHDNSNCTQPAAPEAQTQEACLAQGGQAGQEGPMEAAQVAPGPQAGTGPGCSCPDGGQPQEGGFPYGQQAPYGREPQGCHDPNAGMMMGGPPPQGMPYPGMMGGPSPQGMPYPGMMGGPSPQGMPYPGMMGGPTHGGHSGGCSCHDNPMAGMPQAGPMAGQVPPGNQFGQMFGMVNDLMNGKADPASLTRLLDTSDPRFWKGMLMGAALTFLFTNASAKNSISGLVGNLFGAGKDQDE